MSENSTASSSTENGSVEGSTKARAAHKAVFPTAEQAKAVTPPSERFRVFAVTGPAGAKVFTWAQSVDMAIVHAARTDGYAARVAEPKGGGPLTKERVAAKLAEFTDEELAAMGLTRKKGKKA
jgi:hypothetical protein